jgi:hypothetical protein
VESAALIGGLDGFLLPVMFGARRPDRDEQLDLRTDVGNHAVSLTWMYWTEIVPQRARGTVRQGGV